jgi:PKD repeat protein
MNKEAQKYISVPLIIMMVLSAAILVMPGTVSANAPPVADAEPDYQEVDVGVYAWFWGNNSYDPDGNITFYYWDFGDGNYGYGEVVYNIYYSPGTYNVTLTVYDDMNATDTDTVVVVVFGNASNEPPIAYADPKYQIVSVGEDAWFNGGYSYDPDGWIVSYDWDFGDGNFGSGINTTHQYTTPGTYLVILTVTDNDGAYSSDNCTVEVRGTPGNGAPVADADPDFQVVEVGEEAFFTGMNSYDSDGFIVDYSWDFGDGNFGNGMNVSNIYTIPGNYTVTLYVTDDDNATDSDTCTVVVELSLPAPPTGLDAELVGDSLSDVKLTWTASADDGAGDGDVAIYNIYKSTTGVNGVYNPVDTVTALGSPGHTYEWTDSGAGDGDWNNYFYIVRAEDGFGNEEQNTVKVGKFVSLLDEDWNLFSVPLVQKDTAREVVLQTIDGNYVKVHGYHAGKSRPWLNWHRDKPKKLNDAISIDHKSGFYIDMIVPDYLVTAGKVATSTDINLKTGWNLIGFPQLEEDTVANSLSSIAGKYNKVEYYDTVTDKELRLQPDDLMYPGLGYWIHATDDCVLTLTN